MWKKTTVHILYGIKIIALWCLIANLTIFGFNLVREFKANVTVENAVLMEEYYDYYPGERAAFDADLGGSGLTMIIGTLRYPAGSLSRSRKAGRRRFSRKLQCSSSFRWCS